MLVRGSFLPTGTTRGFLPVARSFVPATTSSADPMSTVSRDATSQKYVPASSEEWATTLTQAGLSSATFAPSALWLLQEASGNPADSIGSFTLTAATTPNYQQTITGWTRKGIVMDDGTGDGLSNAATPNLGTTSQLVLAYVRFPAAAPGTSRSLISLGAAGTRGTAQIVVTSGKLRGTSGANTTDSSAGFCDSTVRPVIVRHNRATSEADTITDLEKLSPTYSGSVTGVGTLLGNAGSQAAAAGFLYAVSFHGAAAEMTDAQIKTLLQTLGWSVSW